MVIKLKRWSNFLVIQNFAVSKHSIWSLWDQWNQGYAGIPPHGISLQIFHALLLWIVYDVLHQISIWGDLIFSWYFLISWNNIPEKISAIQQLLHCSRGLAPGPLPRLCPGPIVGLKVALNPPTPPPFPIYNWHHLTSVLDQHLIMYLGLKI